MKQNTNQIRDGTLPNIQNIMDFLKDKNGNHSLREFVILISLLAIVISWIGEQFFNYTMPAHMFYAFASLIGAGCFGYSIEKNDKQILPQSNQQQEKEE